MHINFVDWLVVVSKIRRDTLIQLHEGIKWKKEIGLTCHLINSTPRSLDNNNNNNNRILTKNRHQQDYIKTA